MSLEYAQLQQFGEMMKRQKFIRGIINTYGLEPDIEEDMKVESQSDTSDQFVKAMIVMKKVKVDGHPGVIHCNGSDFLCIGSVGAAYNLQALQACKITHILCMADVCKAKFPEHFVYKKVSCRDTLDQDLFSVLDECFAFINEFRDLAAERDVSMENTATDLHTHREKGAAHRHSSGNTSRVQDTEIGCGEEYERTEGAGKSRILIHCYQGISRASTICAAYMIQHFGCSVDQALQLIRQCRPQASPNYNFMKSLRMLSTHLEQRMI